MKKILSFTKKSSEDLMNNYRSLSLCQKAQMFVRQGFLSITDYTNGQHYSTLTDLTSEATAYKIRSKMNMHETGRLIIEQKPRITDEFFQALQNLEENSFGKKYFNFMSHHNFKPSQRPVVNYIRDFQLAYVLQRYKEIHDFLHVLLLRDISVQDELLVKWFQMRQLQLPSATLASLVSPLMRPQISLQQMNKAIRVADSSQFMMNIYFQKLVEEDAEKVRKQLGFATI